MITYEQFSENLKNLRAKIEEICNGCNRPTDSVKILPVTKNHPREAVKYAYISGLSAVGENRIQEAVEKKPSINKPIKWELIGHLQSNKVHLAVEHFDRIQSVDSLKLLKKLNKAAQTAGKTLSILLQVNTGNDPAKYGVSCEEAPALLQEALKLKNIKVEGLMTIAPLSDDPCIAERTFIRLRELRNSLEESFACQLNELSMGMTGDLVQAIKAGSTLIRIGSGLFGARE